MMSPTTKACFLYLVLFIAACGPREQSATNQNSFNSNNNQNAAGQPAPLSTEIESKSVDHFAHMKPEHREVLRGWLKSKPQLRPAVQEIDSSMYDDKYKDHFDENLKALRSYVGEDGYQYYSTGDMNQDGKIDFAVLLVDTSNRDNDIDHFGLAIFNAPFGQKASPAYYETGLSGITNVYIEFGRTEKRHLYLGKFESDALCATYYSKGRTYYFKDCM